MSVPNNWESDEIVPVDGNLWWNKTTNVKFYLVNEDNFKGKGFLDKYYANRAVVQGKKEKGGIKR